MDYLFFIGLFIIVLFLYSALRISSQVSRMEEEHEYQKETDRDI